MIIKYVPFRTCQKVNFETTIRSHKWNLPNADGVQFWVVFSLCLCQRSCTFLDSTNIFHFALSVSWIWLWMTVVELPLGASHLKRGFLMQCKGQIGLQMQKHTFDVFLFLARGDFNTSVSSSSALSMATWISASTCKWRRFVDKLKVHLVGRSAVI